jgi:hypothetical protein
MVTSPRDSDPRKTTLARASSIYKRQILSLVREGAPQPQDRNCQTVINIWSWVADGARHQDLLIDRPSVAMWLWFWLWIRGVVENRERLVRDSEQCDQWDISERFFTEIRQTDVLKEFNVWAATSDCNCKEIANVEICYLAMTSTSR